MKHYSGDQIKKNDTNRACSTYGVEVYTWFWLGDTGLDERILLKWIFRKAEWGHGLDGSGSIQGQVSA
jgi:hypothetical protein